MPEMAREFVELKREIVETHNQAIKTDSQIKNLALDIKNFEQRFDALEKRTRMVNMGAHILVAFVIGMASYVILAVKSRHYHESIAALRADLISERQHAQTQNEELRQHLSQLEKNHRSQSQAEELVSKILVALDNKQDKQAGELLEELHPDQLTDLSRRLTEKRLSDLRRKVLDDVMRDSKKLYAANQYDATVSLLRRALALEPENRQSQRLLAHALWSLKRFDEAEPLLRELLKSNLDKSTLTQTQFMLAATLARLGKRDSARSMFEEIAAVNGPYVPAAKNYLQALMTGAEAPHELPFSL